MRLTPKNYSQSGNLPRPNPILVKYTKRWLNFGTPNPTG